MLVVVEQRGVAAGECGIGGVVVEPFCHPERGLAQLASHSVVRTCPDLSCRRRGPVEELPENAIGMVTNAEVPL